MSKIILVTGAAGFIGGETMLRLKDAGHTVVGVDTVALPVHLGAISDRFYQEDFAKPWGLQLLDEFEPQAIIHCAGSSLVGPSLARPADYYNNNFVKTKALLDRIRDRKLNTRVIFSSSAACYGEPVITPCQEEDPCLPISPYGQSKLMIEWMLQSYRRAYGIDFVAFRYFNACGADSENRHGQRSGATHIIAQVFESLQNKRDFVLNGDTFDTPDGTCVRDYIHVQDIADAHILAMGNQIPSGIYNLGTKQGNSNKEIISMVERVTNQKVDVKIGLPRAGDPAVLTSNPEKFYKISGWKAQYSLEEIIHHSWHWYGKS